MTKIIFFNRITGFYENKRGLHDQIGCKTYLFIEEPLNTINIFGVIKTSTALLLGREGNQSDLFENSDLITFNAPPALNHPICGSL